MKIDPGKLGLKGGPVDRAIREIPGTQSTGIPRGDLVSYVFTWTWRVRNLFNNLKGAKGVIMQSCERMQYLIKQLKGRKVWEYIIILHKELMYN